MSKRIQKMKRNKMAHNRGFSLIEVLIVVSIIGILSTFLVPNLVQTHYKGKAVKIMTDMRAIRDIALTYNMDLQEWPRSKGWGKIPKDFQSHFPPGLTFNLGSWDVKYAYSNYSNKSDAWKDKRGYTVILRARVMDLQLANALYRYAPDFFNIVKINRKRGIFTVILE